MTLISTGNQTTTELFNSIRGSQILDPQNIIPDQEVSAETIERFRDALEIIETRDNNLIDGDIGTRSLVQDKYFDLEELLDAYRYLELSADSKSEDQNSLDSLHSRLSQKFTLFSDSQLIGMAYDAAAVGDEQAMNVILEDIVIGPNDPLNFNPKQPPYEDPRSSVYGALASVKIECAKNRYVNLIESAENEIIADYPDLQKIDQLLAEIQGVVQEIDGWYLLKKAGEVIDLTRLDRLTDQRNLLSETCSVNGSELNLAPPDVCEDL